MRASGLLALGLILPLTGCLLAGRAEEPRFSIPAGWDTLEPFAFEALLEDTYGGREPMRFNRESSALLEETLDEMNVRSVRAALLFAHSGHYKSGTVLIRRLKAREVGPTRGADAGDVVAAAALGRFADARELYLDDLRDLAVGRRAHPDLEVRVECAASVLALGDDAPIPFLLKVLRIDTYAGRADERDFEVSETTAWARWRAAEVLSLRAGVPLTYQPDGSISDREREAARLEELLLPAPQPE